MDDQGGEPGENRDPRSNVTLSPTPCKRGCMVVSRQRDPSVKK